MIANPYLERQLPMLSQAKRMIPQPLSWQPVGEEPEGAKNWKDVYYMSGGGGSAPAEYKQVFPKGEDDFKKLSPADLDVASNAKPMQLFRKLTEKVDGKSVDKYEPYKEINSRTDSPEDAVMIYSKDEKTGGIKPQVFSSGEVALLNRADKEPLPRLRTEQENYNALTPLPEEFNAMTSAEKTAFINNQNSANTKRMNALRKKYSTAPGETVSYIDWAGYANKEAINRQRFENGPLAAYNERKREHEAKYGGVDQAQAMAEYEKAKQQIDVDRSQNDAIPANLRKRVASTDGWSIGGTNNIISARPTLEKPSFVAFTEQPPVYTPLQPEYESKDIRGERQYSPRTPKEKVKLLWFQWDSQTNKLTQDNEGANPYEMTKLNAAYLAQHHNSEDVKGFLDQCMSNFAKVYKFDPQSPGSLSYLYGLPLTEKAKGYNLAQGVGALYTEANASDGGKYTAEDYRRMQSGRLAMSPGYKKSFDSMFVGGDKLSAGWLQDQGQRNRLAKLYGSMARGTTDSDIDAQLFDNMMFYANNFLLAGLHGGWNQGVKP